MKKVEWANHLHQYLVPYCVTDNLILGQCMHIQAHRMSAELHEEQVSFLEKEKELLETVRKLRVDVIEILEGIDADEAADF